MRTGIIGKLIILFIVFMGTSVNYAESKITYIANEGFIIEEGGKKIIVDGLFDHINADFCDSPADSVVNLMKNALPPFDNIDYILITHKHRDHFNRNVVAEYMLHNTEALIICPEQVMGELSDHPGYVDFKERIHAVTPRELKDSTINVAGFTVKILRLEHSHYMETNPETGEQVNRHRDIENIGFLFSVGDTKYFHCGDTNPLNEKEYKTFALQNEKINIAFLERMFWGMGKLGQDLINQYINPEKIIVMHISPARKEMFQKYFSGSDNIFMFMEKMETRKF